MRLLNRDGYDATGRRLYYKDAPDPAPAPDYKGAAEQTAQGNIEAARAAAKANRVNTYTPYGSITYAQPNSSDPDQWSANVTLDPTQQKLLDQQNLTSLNLAGLQNSAYGRVNDALNAPYAATYDPTKATNTAYESLMTRLNPQYEQQQSQLDQRLANQGITLGSEAWRNAQNQFGQTRNDAQTQAALQAINLGMQQQQQQYGQESTNRNNPLNELNAIRTGSQVTNPSQINVAQQGQTAGANYLGAAQGQAGYDQSIYNAGVGSANAGNSATAGLAGAAIGAAALF